MMHHLYRCARARVTTLARTLLLLAALGLAGCGVSTQPQMRAELGVVEAVNSDNNAGFARAVEPRPFEFPLDHGAHPAYQTEWWYYTGNLDSADGRHFGFQLTFFRRALTPSPPARDSAWATNNIYMAHLALSDVAGERFYAYDRFSRDGAELAGASGAPFRVFLEDWSATSAGPDGSTMQLRADGGAVALELDLSSSKPAALQGERGLSQKGPTPGNASYYYSLTRMQTSGELRIDGERYAVQGLSWMDHEWGTSALEAGAVGWDWFSVQLDDGRELMYAQVRTPTGISYGVGTLVAPDGSTRALSQNEVHLEALASWRSPRSGATYPARWRLELPAEGLSLEIVPYLADQELPLALVYWEGAVRISGMENGQPLSGNGYVELTGYSAEGQGRF